MHNPPIIIGATGGSGTRVVTLLLQQAGVFMGENLNESLDCIDMFRMLEKHVPAIISKTQSVKYKPEDIPATTRKRILADFKKVTMKIEKQGQGNKLWGWKNPRNIYVLPLITILHPELKFIHVIRDGRDMAYSANQNQTIKHYSMLFKERQEPKQLAERSIRLWNKVNTEANEWATKNMKNNYFLLHFEDLCEDAERTIHELFKWLKIKAPIKPFLKLVKDPKTLKRYLDMPRKEQENLERHAKEGLIKFGYMHMKSRAGEVV